MKYICLSFSEDFLVSWFKTRDGESKTKGALNENVSVRTLSVCDE